MDAIFMYIFAFLFFSTLSREGGLPRRLGGGAHPGLRGPGGKTRPGAGRLHGAVRGGRQLPLQPAQEGTSAAVRGHQSSRPGRARGGGGAFGYSVRGRGTFPQPRRASSKVQSRIKERGPSHKVETALK